MSHPTPNITIPVDLTNPGQFFACCGLLELADRLWPGAEGWFDSQNFYVFCNGCIGGLLDAIAGSKLDNTMSLEERKRLQTLSQLAKSRKLSDAEMTEQSALDEIRRKAPLVVAAPFGFRVDWFCDPFTRGFSLKTWAGRQSVLTIAQDMHNGVRRLARSQSSDLWTFIRDIGLAFNFDSEIGGQGTGRDIGFVFDEFKSSAVASFNRGCRPALELLCFIGLQRFRPVELSDGETFRYSTWNTPLAPPLAKVAASLQVEALCCQRFQFIMFNRNKDYYCFYPAQPYEGDRDE